MSFNRAMARRLLHSVEHRGPRIPGAPRCPHCSRLIDAASIAGSVDEDGDEVEKVLPTPGDLAVCCYCAGAGVYGADGKVSKLDIMTLDERARRLVRDAQEVITQARQRGMA